jgi:signal transduction histidine kinase
MKILKVTITILSLIIISQFHLIAVDSISDIEKNITTMKGKNKLQGLLRLSAHFSELQPDRGQYYGNEALKMAITLNDKSSEGSAYFNIGRSYDFANQFIKGIDYYNKSKKIYEELDSKKDIALCLMNIGTDYNDLGNYNLAIENLKLALDYSLKAGGKSEGDIYNNLAISYVMQGNYKLAIEYYTKSLKITEAKGNTKNIAYCLNNIGLVYLDWTDFSSALNYFNKGLKTAEEFGDKRTKKILLSNISSAYLGQNLPEKALEYQNRALSLALEMNDKVQIAKAYDGIGIIYDKLGNNETSMQFKLKYIKILEEIGDKSGLGFALMNIGNKYLNTGQFKTALEYFSRSLEIANQINYNKLICYNYYNLSDTWLMLGDYKKSRQYLKNYITLKDSIFNDESTNMLQNMRISYETEKKDKENVLLKEKNSIQIKYFIIVLTLILLLLILIINRYIARKKSLKTIYQKNKLIQKAYEELTAKNHQITDQNIELEALNNELINSNIRIHDQNSELEYLNQDLKDANASKDKFFLIISHELMGPIRWLKNVSGLLLNKVDHIKKDELKETIQILNATISDSNQLLENLLHWARVNSGRIICLPEETNINEVINDNILSLHDRVIDKQLNIKLEINEDIQILADRNMLNSVIRNLLTNAVKFTKTGGDISIKSDLHNGSINIHVIDTGIGIKKEDLDKLFKIDTHFTTLGTENEKGTGLGLILCKEYLERCGGKISVESEYSKGSKFSFSIPIQKP